MGQTYFRKQWAQRASPAVVVAVLLAMLLRALVPAGYMPSSTPEDHSWTITICTADGDLQTMQWPAPHPEPPDDQDRASSVCDYALLAQLLPAPDAPVLPAPARAVLARVRPVRARLLVRPRRYTLRPTRAPPRSL